MNGNTASLGPATHSLQSLIKPEQVAALANFPDDQKAKYVHGISKLWETINNFPAESGEYQAAYKKLIEVSINIKKSLDQRKEQAQARAAAAAAAAGQNGARPPAASTNTEQRPPSQAAQAQPQAQEQFSRSVMERVEKLQILVPPQYIAQNGQESVQNYVKSMKHKYAQAVSRYEQAEAQIKKWGAMKQQRASSGKPFTPEEMQQVQAQNTKLQGARDQSLEWLKQFGQQQDNIKNQVEQNQKANNETATNENVLKQETRPQAGGIAQSGENQAHANNVGANQDASSRDANVPARSSAMSPPEQVQAQGQAQRVSQQQPMNPPSNSQPPSAPTTQSHPAAIKTEPPFGEQKFNLPAVPAIHPPHHAEPQPLKHEDALEKARSFSQPGYPQNAPQSATHGHPPQHNQREGQPNSHSKMPVPKELNIPPPQPVSMSTSRPTLPNGPQMMGPIGQPAIQRMPGYVLEGDGERVLSKKKLEELVRQVTGGTGAEGDEGETLTADVEETLLDVADEFVDQVITSACKLAKLRQSSTLELRDIQLILERNYNIRVPGYASDELRTVRKIQPAPGWTQKLSAVQAAKVTGGKGDL